MTSSVNNDSLEMQFIVMASVLNSNGLHRNGFRTEFMWLYKVIADVVVIYCYVKNGWTWRSKKSKNHVDLTLVENYLRHQQFPDGISTKGDKVETFKTAIHQNISRWMFRIISTRSSRIDMITVTLYYILVSIEHLVLFLHVEKLFRFCFLWPRSLKEFYFCPCFNSLYKLPDFLSPRDDLFSTFAKCSK